MTTIKMHPSELAYAFSYSETVDIVGWGRDPFLPTTQADGDPKNWYADGAARSLASGHLVESADDGVNFTDEVTAAVLAIVDPSLVLLVERKAGEGLRRLTVHLSNDAIVGMTRDADGLFELVRYADLTAAVVACVGFVGASLTPTQARGRIDTTQKALSEVHQLASAGEMEPASASLLALGASAEDASSITQAMANPAASGVVSVLYCSDNVAQLAEPFSVMTNEAGDTWIIFPPASLEGPMVLEQSSVPALAGRILVGVAARAKAAA